MGYTSLLPKIAVHKCRYSQMQNVMLGFLVSKESVETTFIRVLTAVEEGSKYHKHRRKV
jgi:hypothetical protein